MSLGISPNIVVDAEGLDPAEDLERVGSIAQKRSLGKNKPGEADNFYGPWRGGGMRVELRHIRGVTAAKILQQPFRFQVPPMESFHVDEAVVANDYPTIQKGTFTDVNGMELATVSFETLATIEPAPWAIAKGMWDPTKVVRQLSALMRSETPMQLVAWHPGPLVELSMAVTIRSLGHEEREPDARYLTPSFTEWNDPILERRDKKNWPQKDKLTATDTLASLAKKFWGAPSEARWLGRSIDGLGDWGIRTPIVKSKKYKVGDTVEIPEPPETGLAQRVAA